MVAPRNASRPSSSSLNTSTAAPAAPAISRATASEFLASRIAAVATIRIASAPSSSREPTWVVTTSHSSATFSGVILPRRFAALSIRV